MFYLNLSFNISLNVIPFITGLGYTSFNVSVGFSGSKELSWLSACCKIEVCSILYISSGSSYYF